MTQTLSINALDTKKIDAMESELIQLNNLTPSEIIARMNQLHDKYSLEYKKDKDKMSSELRVKYEELLAAMKRDMAEMEWKMNSSEKTGVHMQTLDALRNFQSVAVTTSAKQTIVQSTEKSAEVISVTQKTPETFTVNMDATSAEALKKFQKSAAEAFKAEVLGSDGKPDYLSLRRGLELISSLEELQSIDTKAFDTLKDEEKEKLKEQLPAVRGVIGAIFVESLFADGYTIAFNGDGTVNMRARSGISDVNQKMSEINTAIKRDPTLSQTLKMGLLYADGDLLKYMQSVATSDGNNITPEMQTPGEFLKYLNNRDQNTLAGDAIKSSANFFENINLPEQMKAANYIPEIGNALSTIMPDPNAMVSVQRAVEGVKSTVGNSNDKPMSRSEAFGQGVGGWTNSGTWKDKGLDQSRAEHGNVGGFLEQVGYSWMKGASSLMSSPAAATVTVVGIFALLFTRGFKDTVLALMTGPLALGGGQKLFEYFTGKKAWGNGSAPREATTQDAENATPPAPDADLAVIRNQREILHGKENAEKVTELMWHFDNANHKQVLDYIAWNRDVNITDEQKKLLDDAKNAEVVKKDIESYRNQYISRIEKELTEIGGVPVDQKSAIMNEIDTISVKELINRVNMSEQDFDTWVAVVKAKLNEKIQNDPTIPPEAKTWFEKALDGATTYTFWAAIGVSFAVLLRVMFGKNLVSTGVMTASLFPFWIIGKIANARTGGAVSANPPEGLLSRMRQKLGHKINGTTPPPEPKLTWKQRVANTVAGTQITTAEVQNNSNNTKNPTTDTPKTQTPEEISSKHADISDAVNNAEVKINGQDVILDANGIKRHNEFREKLQKLSTDPSNTALRTEVQKAFNNFYYSVDPDGKVITKDIRMKIADDIINSKLKLPTSVDDFLKMAFETRK